MIKIIKLILAALLLICLADMPYGYYQFVRISAMLGFVFLAWNAYEQKQDVMMLAFIALAILFQPFEKIALGREIWNTVDVIVAVGLLASIWIKPVKRQ